MTVKFRIDAISLDTDAGSDRHEFAGPLTVLSGPVGVGKSTIFELMKYCMGGSVRIAPVARDHVRSVTLDITIGNEKLRLTRPLVGDVAQVLVRSGELGTPTPVPVKRTSKKDQETTVGEILMSALGLPTDATYTSQSRTARISFNNVFSYLYVEQREIDRSIAHNTDPYAEPARKATFELLFGISDPNLMELRTREKRQRDAFAAAEREEATVRKFLADSRTASADEVKQRIRRAEENLTRAKAARAEISSVVVRSDGVLDIVRQMVLTARDDLGTVMARKQQAEVELRDSKNLQASLLARDKDLQREESAGDLLGPIDFVICPRCTQDVRHRQHPEGACTLCLQPEPQTAELLSTRAADERLRLASQRREVDLVVESKQREVAGLEQSMRAAGANLAKAEQLLDERSAEFVSPRLEEYADAVAAIARAESETAELEMLLRQWDRVNDLARAAALARHQLQITQQAATELEKTISMRRDETLEELNDNYRTLVGKLRVPTVTSASIDPRSYLPMANGVRFDKLSTGGITTALVCAYWVALLATALRNGVTTYPALLIIDTPRKSIGQQNSHIVDALYRELDTLSNAYPEQLQVIVADNDVPKLISQEWEDLRFSYDVPTVASVPHPGEANVTALEDKEADPLWSAIDV